MKNKLLNISLAAVLTALSFNTANAELRLDESFNYADGELNAVSSNFWRLRQTPYAVVENNAIVVDYTQGLTFNGGYQVLWPAPAINPLIFTSFMITVTVAPQEEVGYSFVGVADADNPDLYRARVWMKKGNAPDTFRLGMSIQSGQPFDENDNPNVIFFPADLQLNEEYFVATRWDNANLVSRLYIDSNDVDSPRVELTGGTPRNAGFRRFGITMNSANHLGRYEIRNVRVAEEWDLVLQSFSDKGEFEVDPEPGTVSIWPESSFAKVDGIQDVALGLIQEFQWPWIYSFALESWISVSADSTLESMYLYHANGSQWLWSSESLDGWYYNYNSANWDHVAN